MDRDLQPAFCSHPAALQDRLFPASDYVTGDAFEVRRCRQCSQAYTWPQPPAEDLQKYYPPTYYGEAGQRRYPAVVEWLQAGLYRRRANRLQRLAGGSPGRVLDVGCGKGDLLHAFQLLGWQTLGIELSEASARIGREQFGLTVLSEPLADLSLAAGSFEVITLWHVLEHAQEPEQMLTELYRLLVPGGILLVSVPDFGSAEARLCGPGWFHLDVPRHLFHFTRSRLEGLCSQIGFQWLSRWVFAPEFDLYSFIQSIQNRLGLPANLLYRLLRQRSARLPGGRFPFWGVTLAVTTAPLLGIIGLPWILFAGWLRSGSTTTQIFRKP